MQATNILSRSLPAPFSGAGSSSYYGWILHPVIDLWLCCGGLVWLVTGVLLLGSIPYFSTQTGAFVSAVAVAALLLFQAPHQLATYERVFCNKLTRNALGKQVLGLGLICLILGALAATSPLWASLVLRLRFCFTFQHVYAQSYGVALLYCYKRNYIFSKNEKRIFFSLIQAGICLSIARILAIPQLTWMGLKLENFWTPLPQWVCLGFTAGVIVLSGWFAFVVARRWMTKREMIPLPAVFTVVTAFFVFAYLPEVPQFDAALFMLSMGLFHYPQYLVITTAYHLKEVGLPKDVPTSKISTQLIKPRALCYLVSLTAGAVVLIVFLGQWLLPMLAHAGMSFKPELITLAGAATLNLHHCWIDSLIWRLKDKSTQKILLS